MTTYTIVKFLHVVGAIGYFAAISVLLFTLVALRRANRVEQVRTLSSMAAGVTRLFYGSVLVLLAAGLYMAFTTWGFEAGWIDVALVALVIMFPAAGIIVQSRQRVTARMMQAATDGPLPGAIAQRLRDPVLLMTPVTSLWLLLGIEFLMTNKPALVNSLIVMAVALLLGLTSGWLAARWRPRPLDVKGSQSGKSAG